jgi:hypothetical protein
MFPLKSNKNILNFLIAYDMNIITNQKHASELMSLKLNKNPLIVDGMIHLYVTLHAIHILV